MQQFTELVKLVSGFLWDYLLLFLLCGTGIYFTLRLKFVQVRKFGVGLKMLFGGFNLRGEAADQKGMSSFQALTTAIAAQVGTGNITGCAMALASGGPGAIFWMWVSAFFGMATIYSEAVLAQKFRTVKDGQITGGPIYYIRGFFRGRFGKVLSVFFSIALILSLGLMGNMVQSNSIGSAFHNAFGVPPLAVGVVVTVIAGFIFLGGVKRLASVTEKLVPVMAILYILGCLIILGINHDMVLTALQQIFVLAFKPQAMAGGVLGVTIKEAMRYGVARGLFSNEAGMGSTPHAHALAKVKKPEDQGIVAMMGVFIDTFIVLTLTALVILTSGMLSTGETGTTLAQMAFNQAFGSFGNIFVACCMLFFAFSTIIGWYFFGEVNVRALFGKKAIPVYSLLVLVFVMIGSSLQVDLVWSLSDLFNGLMVLPNLIGLLALSGLVARITKGIKDPKDDIRYPDDPEVQKLMQNTDEICCLDDAEVQGPMRKTAD
ncbi:MAG TPA: sodium:alanine symporter family protein [Candidatus Faecivivens stercoripullorum]|uniref:Sodium:alanine symporter family protein n=1 Tax=Candidatus Faecivivens stercoripullorum TaxID=2840805 RepID=A0A9D1H5Y8_9FIRM|nr:sodium:alanine symporter family protein [Candidatus Faecivivens stercoripullorum]